MVAYEQVTAQLNDRMGIVWAALNVIMRMEVLHAEERTKQGPMNLVFWSLDIRAGPSAHCPRDCFAYCGATLKIAGVGMYLFRPIKLI